MGKQLNGYGRSYSKMYYILFFTPVYIWENQMHGHDVQEVLYQYCEIHDPWERNSGLGSGQYDHNFSLLKYLFEEN